MRRAFVMGSNGPADLKPLRYARQDAERMKACLAGTRCAFDVAMPETGADTFEIRRQLSSVAESCTSADTFVCYFSGHGLLEKGTLVLLWENTQLNRLLTTALPVSDILQVLKYCEASSKLLILDCCHAGAVVNMLGLKDASGMPIQELEIRSDNYLILMASDRLEEAREFETLQGSFLTAHLTAALDEKSDEADKDHDGRISIQDLKLWLEERAKVHNQQFPNRRVPYPYLFGQQKGGGFLTLNTSDWIPYEFDWPDGSTMVVLPIRSHYVPCISQYPVTNAQYRRFVESIYPLGQEPVGEHFHQSLSQQEEGPWQGPFYPWREDEFRAPDKPVVCVSFEDALDYCD